MKYRLPYLLLIMIFLGGCFASSGNGLSRQQYYDAMVGKNKAACVEKFGLPDKTLEMGTSEIWEYKLNLHKFTSPTGYRFSTYDLLRLTFKKDILISWSLKTGEM